MCWIVASPVAIVMALCCSPVPAVPCLLGDGPDVGRSVVFCLFRRCRGAAQQSTVRACCHSAVRVCRLQSADAALFLTGRGSAPPGYWGGSDLALLLYNVTNVHVSVLLPALKARVACLKIAGEQRRLHGRQPPLQGVGQTQRNCHTATGPGLVRSGILAWLPATPVAEWSPRYCTDTRSYPQCQRLC